MCMYGEGQQVLFITLPDVVRNCGEETHLSIWVYISSDMPLNFGAGAPVFS